MFAFQKKDLKSIEGPKAPWVLIFLCLVLLAVAVSFFGQKSLVSQNPLDNSVSPSIPLETKAPRIYTVSYKAGVFSPTNLRIHAGDTVRFKNEGFFAIHIASDDSTGSQKLAGFDSIGDIPQNSYFSFTFSEKGIFGYHNEKRTDEAGTIIVR